MSKQEFSENRYNTKVRMAMSDKLVKLGKQISETKREIIQLTEKLNQGRATIPYDEYITLERDRDFLSDTLYRYEIERSVWDEAREICLTVAEDVG